MFEHLIQYQQIFVTGPQRSGTRIAAKMIAEDTGYEYIDEHEFGIHSKKQFKKIARRDYSVIQCPGVNHVIDQVSTTDNLVVMMIRDIDDILASEKRIGWFYGVYDELIKYDIPYEELNQHAKTGCPVALLKYDLWETELKDRIFNYFELDYDSLSDHPLWVPKELRTDFGAEQTHVEL